MSTNQMQWFWNNIHTSVTLPDDFSVVTGTLACTMKYKIKDCDPGTGQSDDDQDGYPDESVV